MNGTIQKFAAALPDGGTGTVIPGTEAPLNVVAGYAVYGVLALCVIGLIIQFGKMAIGHSRREPADVSGLGMVAMAIVGALSATALVSGIAGVG